MSNTKWQDLCLGKKILYGTEENFEKSKEAQRQAFIDTFKKPEPKDTVETLYKKLKK